MSKAEKNVYTFKYNEWFRNISMVEGSKLLGLQGAGLGLLRNLGRAENVDKFCNILKLSINSTKFLLFMYHSGFPGNIGCSEYLIL